MTITKYDKFAIKPKRCWYCNKLFIFEWYNYTEMDVAPCTSIIKNKCQECIEKRKEDAK